MTISKIAARKSYTGNGSTVAFSFPYRVLVDADVAVYLKASGGVEVLQTLATHYTITNTGTESGVTVTMIAAPATAAVLTIAYDMDITQSLDYLASDPFPAESHEDGLDRLTLIAQEAKDKQLRTLRVAVSESNPIEIVPVADTRIGFDGSLTLTTFPSGAPLSYVNVQLAKQFKTDAEMAADTGGYTTYQTGDWFHVLETNVYFKVAAIVAIDEDRDFTGTGGVKVHVQAGADGAASVEAFGAIGDYDGTTVTTDSTTAIDAALTWWAAAGGRRLHFPDGWFYYAGNKVADLGYRYFNTLTCDGQITFAHTTGIGWEIHNHRSMSLQVNMRNGGVLGDFSVLIPTSGTTAIQIHRSQQFRGNVREMNYIGRGLHLTAKTAGDDFSRNIRASVNVWFGNRALSGDDARCGQPLCWDTGGVANIGGAGEVSVNGSACEYGPLFADMNDLHVLAMEMGPFITMGCQFEGVSKAKFEDFWCGESDNTTAVPILIAEPSARGTKCGSWIMDSLRTLSTSGAGVHFNDFDTANPGTLRINNVECATGDTAITIEDIPDARIMGIAAKAMKTAVKIVGTCGRVELGFDDTDSLTEDILQVTGNITEELVVSGRLDGGAATFSLIDLGPNNYDVLLDNTNLDSSVCAQKINIGFAGANKIRHLGGSVEGTSPTYTSGRRPERVVDVRGNQSKSIGKAFILNGQTQISFNHNLAFTPENIQLTGITSEVAGVFVSAFDATQITAKVAVAVTGDKTIHWKADSETQADDADA